MYLLIDDVRDLGCEAIARTSEAARLLLPLGEWECVCFDHDLGLGEETGYQILVWAIENNHLPNKVQLVTSNPVGKKSMAQALIIVGFTTKNGVDFERVEPRGRV
jgi:hypothetical protein